MIRGGVVTGAGLVTWKRTRHRPLASKSVPTTAGGTPLMHCQLLIVLDAGKTEHHATAPLPDGTIVRNKPLPQSEAQLREFFTELPAQHGR